jgi:hypothetical protein
MHPATFWTRCWPFYDVRFPCFVCTKPVMWRINTYKAISKFIVCFLKYTSLSAMHMMPIIMHECETVNICTMDSAGLAWPWHFKASDKEQKCHLFLWWYRRFVPCIWTNTSKDVFSQGVFNAFRRGPAVYLRVLTSRPALQSWIINAFSFN